jgi:hypothetical protein
MTKHVAVLLRAVACATGIASNRLSGQRRGETVIETEVISVPVTVNDRRGNSSRPEAAGLRGARGQHPAGPDVVRD